MLIHHKKPMLDLFLAIRSGDCEKIELIILDGIDVNARNDEPITIEGLTYWAIRGSNDFAAKFIGCTPLHIASYFQQLEAVELLLSKLGADVTMIASEILFYHLSGDVECLQWRYESVTALHLVVCGDHTNYEKGLANYVIQHIMQNDIDVVERKATAVELWYRGKRWYFMERGTAFQLALAFSWKAANKAEIAEDLVVLGRAYRGVGEFNYEEAEEYGTLFSNDPRDLRLGRDLKYLFDWDLDEITKYKEELRKALSYGLKDMPDYIVDCVKDFAEPTTRELVQKVYVHSNNDNYKVIISCR